jgi:hypothetical protein
VIHNIFQRIIKSRGMRWAGHVACMREENILDFGGKPERQRLL